MYNRIFNFNAGPAVLPECVLEQARDEMMNHKGSGMSVMEMSHRSKEYDAIIKGAEAKLRQVMAIPENYVVLFLQGGASLQFAMVPMNLYVEGKPVDVIHTGAWTEKAIKELQVVCPFNVVATTEKENFKRLPTAAEMKFSADPSYVHVCTNNTIFGTQWQQMPATPSNVPVVADMSSDIMSRVLDISTFGLIFAGAQKNIGPSGVTLVVIRKDLLERTPAKKIPTILKYTTHAKEPSLYNTPPTFGIYLLGLVMDWVINQGGLAALEKVNVEKARILYDAIDSIPFYYATVAEKESRSKMNVNFRVKGDKEELEEKFVKEAKAAGMVGLKGHRSVGGLRASIYNAHPIEGVKALIAFMKEFAKKNG